MHLVEKVHAFCSQADRRLGWMRPTGVMRYLEERGIGFDVGVARVPIVPAAVIFDLAIGRADVRPDAAMAYQACLNATTDPVMEGSVGAGTGATVGKILGMQNATKSGVGSACVEIVGGLFVGAIVVVNALGDVIDPQTSRDHRRGAIGQTGLRRHPDNVMQKFHGAVIGFDTSNTVIGVVATNAKLSKEEANKVAQMAHDGLARADSSRAYDVRRRYDLRAVHGRPARRMSI